MKKSYKKILTVLLSVAVMIGMMSIPTFAADTTATAETNSTDLVSDLGMFTPTTSNFKMDVNKMTGNVEVTFTTKALSVQYVKLALKEQTATDAVKDKNAYTSTISGTTGKYTSTFTVKIPASKIGQKIPFSLYQKYTSKDGTAVDGWKNLSKQYYLTLNNSPQLVSDLTSAIYYQEKTAGTDELCKAAKTCWDNLRAADKLKVPEFGYYENASELKGGPDYFGEDTGDATKDNAGNADNIGSCELLVASFGTSYNTSRIETIGGVENALAKAYPKYSVRRGFTSQIIINHIQSRDNEFIDNIDDAMERAINNHVKVLVVQPTQLMSGAEYDELVTEVNQYKSKFQQIVFSKPLCNTDSDKKAVATAIYEAAAKDAGYADTASAIADKDTAFVFMGHGTSHQAQALYDQMQTVVTDLGYKNCFIGTVEGKPADTSLESVIAKVKNAGYKKVVLRPLMVVAGDHAHNDMAGKDADSWKSSFTAAGFATTAQISGLGQLPTVQQLYVAHTKDAMATVVTATSFSKVKAGKKSVTLTVKKHSNATGYQVRYAKAKSMKNAKTITIKGASKTTKTIKKLTSNKKYYLQVRTYSSNGHSDWSKVKSVKVK